MAGFSIDIGGRDVVYADNVDFSGGATPLAQVLLNGQLLIGSSVPPNIRVGTLGSSDGSITWTVGNGTITGQVTGGTTVLKSLTGDTGTATPTSGSIKIAGGTNINTSATGSTVTINLNNQILQAVGSMAAPSYSFAGNANTGMYWTGTEIAFAIAGNNALNFNSGTMSVDTSALFMNPLVTFQSGIQYNYTQPGSYPYSVVHSGNYDYYVSVDTTSARTINLPNTTGTGVTYVIKDRTGNSGTNNITVTTPGSTVTIDGATTYIMNVNFEARQFIFNGTNWEVW